MYSKDLFSQFFVEIDRYDGVLYYVDGDILAPLEVTAFESVVTFRVRIHASSRAVIIRVEADRAAVSAFALI